MNWNYEGLHYNQGLSEHIKHSFTWSLWVTTIQFPEIVFFYWVFQMNKSLVLIAVIAAAALSACGKKEEAAVAPAAVASAPEAVASAVAPVAAAAASAVDAAGDAAKKAVDAAAGAAQAAASK